MSTEKKVDNSIYRTTIVIGASRLKQVLWYYTNVFFFNNGIFIFSGIKVALLKLFGAKIGEGVVVKPSVNIKYPWKLEVGNHTWIGEKVWIDNLSDVKIGSNVTLSQGCMLLTGTHDHTRVSFDFLTFPIILEDGAWIGAKALVSGGVVCKTHSILGINSVAESTLEPYTIYKGNPAIPVIKRSIV